VSGEQHLFVFGLHVPPPAQPPQFWSLPHPSPMKPQSAPSALHALGAQAAPQVPFARQTWPLAHEPHWSVPPHWLVSGPHSTPAATHSEGFDGAHVFATPPAPHA
jgi:hypothetical protein